jgi:tRNA pseudouridine-54 N-methylase
MFKNVKAAGGNSMRWWLHTNASFSPDINSNGFCTGISASAIQDVKTVLDLAQKDGIVLDLCLFSFDMLQKEYHMSDANNLKFLTSKANIQSYIDNALTPLVNAVKSHPAIWCWEVFNEPEGMTNEFGWTGVQPATGAFVKGLRCDMSDIQRGVNMIAGAIHRLDKNNPVTNGTYAFMSLSDTKWTTDTRAQNYYRDDRLIAAGGDKDGTLDFYEVHYYESSFGLPQSPFNHDKSYWGLDKPVVVAEFYVQDTYGVKAADLFNELYSRGYAGGLGWAYTDKWAEIQTGVTAAYNAHKSDITINTSTSQVTPTISIALTTGSNPSCASDALTFTATRTNGGSMPIYQWKSNGNNVGINSSTYTSTGLSDGSIITCVMTSNAQCVTTATATSNGIKITRNAQVAPTISIALTTGSNPSCASDALTFTATRTNGGSTPIYQWKSNGNNVGTNSSTYTSTGLSDGSTVTCVMTSNAQCVTTAAATSNGIKITRNAQVIPTISIALTTGSNPSCASDALTFKATRTNGGSTPIYQWKSNGNNVGTNSSTYTSTSLSDGSTVTCVMTSNAQCVTTATATSNGIKITRNAQVIPTVSIALTTGSNPSCASDALTFTATQTNGGGTPSYQWKVDGVNQGTNAAIFASSTLANNVSVTCVLTSNATCVSALTASSNAIKIQRNAVVLPTVIIAQTFGVNPSCLGDSLSFTATQTNGGSSPSYQWKSNGFNVGTNSPIYNSKTLSNGAALTCVMTSNAQCASISKITSNPIAITRTALVTPTVSIIQTTGSNPSCIGDAVVFTATPTNGGSIPSYQWKVDGVNQGTNAAIFTSSTVANNAAVTCVLTSNALCAITTTAISNNVTITRNPLVTPTISIAQTKGNNPSCISESLTFTATSTNAGAIPSYQWQVDGNNQGTNAVTFTSSTLANNAKVTCLLASNATCAAINTVSSNIVAIQRTATVTPTVSIATAAGASCTGQSLTFIATPTNGGTTPSYQWKVDGNNQGTDAATFTSSTLTNNAEIACVMTTTITCASNPIATSNSINQVVKAVPIANAGSDRSVDNNVSFNLEGNALQAGEIGLWTTTSAGIISTPMNATSSVTGFVNATGTFRWTISNGACSAYDEVEIHAGLSPSVEEIIGFKQVVAGVTYNYSVTPHAGESYSWAVSPGATITSNMGNSIQVVFDAGFSGTVSLTITNSFGIAQMHTDIVSAVSTGIYSSNANKVVALAYPTPFSDVVHIKVESMQTEIMHVTIMDMSGKQVFVSDAYQTNELIDLGAALSNGMYVVQVLFGSEMSVVKIVKQNK